MPPEQHQGQVHPHPLVQHGLIICPVLRKNQDKVLAACARELWFLAATADHNVKIEHRHGHSIPLADALSRRFFDPAKELLTNKLLFERNLVHLSPKVDNLLFFHDV